MDRSSGRKATRLLPSLPRRIEGAGIAKSISALSILYNYNLKQHVLIFQVKISSPQYWDILANYAIPKHSMEHIDIQ